MKKLYSIIAAVAVGISAAAGVGQPSSPSLSSMAKDPFSRIAVSTGASNSLSIRSRAAASGQWSDWESVGKGVFSMDDMFASFTGLDE